MLTDFVRMSVWWTGMLNYQAEITRMFASNLATAAQYITRLFEVTDWVIE